MLTEYEKKYRRKNVERLQIDLYDNTDDDIKKKLSTVGAKATYIKRLIREDIKRSKENETV